MLPSVSQVYFLSVFQVQLPAITLILFLPEFQEYTVIHFVSTSTVFGISTVMCLNGTLFESKILSVPLRPTTVQIPNLTLVEMKRIPRVMPSTRRIFLHVQCLSNNGRLYPSWTLDFRLDDAHHADLVMWLLKLTCTVHYMQRLYYEYFLLPKPRTSLFCLTYLYHYFL